MSHLHFHEYANMRSTVQVDERRAPTDESVRLLREMEQKAREQVLKSVRLEAIDFDCVIHSMFDSINAQQVLLAQFQLKGKRLQVEHCFSDAKTDDAIDGLIQAIAHRIAAEIVSPALTKKFFYENGLKL